MSNKPIIIVSGDPKSVFFEIFLKSFKKKYNSPIILIASLQLLKNQMKFLNYNYEINIVKTKNLKKVRLKKNIINLINIDLKKAKGFNKNKNYSKIYLENSFKEGFKIIKSGISNKLINGPISKSNFLEKKFLGVTEYLSKKFNIKKSAMLIYNRNLSVCPLTTHLPIQLVSKNINQKLICEKVILLNNFYRKILKIKPKIAVLGLNPHCESIAKINEDETIVKPAIKKLKKLNYSINGPFSADTFFLKQNRKKFNVVLGMYHDQVLAPIKTLFEYDAINITLGLPFLRVSPDHGPNINMINKNLSNAQSLIKAISFLDKN